MSRKLSGYLEVRARSGLAADLKRLALLFDGYFYDLPGALFFEDQDAEMVGSKLRVNGKFDIARLHSLHRLDPESYDLLQAFGEAGIAQYAHEVLSGNQVELDRELFSKSVISDLSDPNFPGFDESMPSITRDGKFVGFKVNSEHIMKMELRSERGDIRHINYLKAEPTIVYRSRLVNDALIQSARLGAQPIFLDPELLKVMIYRYNKYRKAIDGNPRLTEALRPVSSEIGSGRLAFHLSSLVFSDDALSGMSAEEIIRYRDEMNVSRERFLSNVMAELSKIVSGERDPSSQVKEVERYYHEKIYPEIEKYEENAITVWEKLFGRGISSASRIAQTTLLGGATGGVLGSLFPVAGPLQLLAIGALVGVAKEIPSVTDSVIDTILEMRKAKRQSISYIVRLSGR